MRLKTRCIVQKSLAGALALTQNTQTLAGCSRAGDELKVKITGPCRTRRSAGLFCATRWMYYSNRRRTEWKKLRIELMRSLG